MKKAKFKFSALSEADQERYRELNRVVSQGQPRLCPPTLDSIIEDDLFRIQKQFDFNVNDSEYKRMEAEYFKDMCHKKNYYFELDRWEREVKPKQQAELDKYLAAKAEMKRLRNKATA